MINFILNRKDSYFFNVELLDLLKREEFKIITGQSFNDLVSFSLLDENKCVLKTEYVENILNCEFNDGLFGSKQFKFNEKKIVHFLTRYHQLTIIKSDNNKLQHFKFLKNDAGLWKATKIFYREDN